MSVKNDQLKAELLALLAKYGAKITGLDDYDGDEEYRGTSYAITGDDIYLTIEELAEPEE